MKPVEEIPIPITDPFNIEEGYYLFEDTYPNVGDYDYNDVIVQYEWRHYPTTTKRDYAINRVNCSLEGYGCNKVNEFGFVDVSGDHIHHKIFEDISGYANVGGPKGGPYQQEIIDLEYDGLRDFEYEFNGEKRSIVPYLYNGTGYIQEDKTGSTELPYVLKVPYVYDDNTYKGFRWMVEKKHILEGYNSITTDGWYRYNNIKTDDALMMRE